MIIENEKDVTTAVLSELSVHDARFKEIMSAFVRHLHDFARGEADRGGSGRRRLHRRPRPEDHRDPQRVVLMSGSLLFHS